MFSAAPSRHQFHSQHQQLLAPLTDSAATAAAAADERYPAGAPVSPSLSSPSSPHDGAPGPAGDSPSAAGVATADDGLGSCPAQPAAAPRRRAVDASDLRQCALVQTRLKAWKSGYVSFIYLFICRKRGKGPCPVTCQNEVSVIK